MAQRNNRFLIKRSNVAGKSPSNGDLFLGELALNTADVILYASGTTSNSILPIGWDRVSKTGDTINGNLTITGNTNISGSTNISGDLYAKTLVSTQSIGDEGGEIGLATPKTNTSLSGGSIIFDIYQNKIRFFEGGGSNRGVYIDLTATAAGVGTNLLSGGGGEINTASNLGSGTGLFAQKVAADLQFKSLTSTGGTVTISNDSTTVNLEANISSTFTGGTVSGGTVFLNGVTANTISNVDYINFKTSPSVPNPTGGTLYFDSNENALSYKPLTNQNDVTVNLGQESLIRIYNNLGYQINNGQVLHITGSTSGVPTVALANASKLGATFTESLAQTSGVATHDIPSGQYGFMTNFGIVRDLNTTAFTTGQEVFLSDTVDGGLTNDPNNIAFTSRISTVGYCLESNATTGKILVVITNENPLQSLTQQEINVLLGNTISTGAYFYTGATTASTTTVNVSPMRGWVVYNTGPTYATNPLVLNVYYSGGTNIAVTGLTSSFDTYLLVNSGGTLYQTNSFPSPQERRENIFLGRVVHPNKTTILNVEQSVDYDVSPLSSLRDLWVPIKIINEGVVPSPNGATLTFKTSSGTFWGNGIGFPTNELNPNAITVPGYLPASFYYTTQTGGTFTSKTTTVDATNYDDNGVITNVPGNGNYTTQRIYMSQSGVIRLQYGQNYYSTLAKAIAAIPSETFVVNPDNSIDCTLIGLLTVKDGTSDLSNVDEAVFTFVSKFGEILGGTAGISTTTLQQAYNNSVNPEIVTNTTLGAVQFKGGTGSDTGANIVIENNAGNATGQWLANGYLSATTIQSNGFIANSNGLTATTVSATTIITNGTRLNNDGLTATTVSATTISATTLDISGNTSSDLVKITQTGSGNAILIEDSNRPDSSPFVVDASGNTGIGVSVPSSRLEIRAAGSNAATNSFKIKDFTNTVDLLSLGDTGIFSLNHPTFTGTFSIRMTANNTVVFDNSGIGNFIQFGPTNVVNTLGQTLVSGLRGAQFGSTLSNPVQVPYAVNISTLPAQSTGSTSNVNALLINPSITTTSSYTGTYRGMYYNPTVSITTGTTHLAIETTSGDILFGTTSGNVGIGTVTPRQRLDVNGNAIISNSLTATTISATTYQNLPTDITITGGTYSNNNFTFTNNTGGTFSINNVNTMTGLTVNGNLVSSSVSSVYVSPYVTIGAAYTATTSNSTIEISGGTFTLALYTAVGNSGRTIYIKNSGSGLVTVDANASETIDGQLTRPLSNLEDLLLQSNGSNWVILNRKPVVMQFAHDSVAVITPADATTYYIGNFVMADPATSSGATRQVIALSSGWVRSATLMVSVAGTLGSAGNSTFSLVNVTTGLVSVISSTVSHTTAAQLLSFTLASPMLVRKGDLLQINWLTPTWGTNPSSVRQALTILIE